MTYSLIADSDRYALAAVQRSTDRVLTFLGVLTTSTVFHSAKRGTVTLVEHQGLVFGSGDQAR